MFEFLGEKFKIELKRFKLNSIYEVRLREGCPLFVNFGGVKRFLNVTATKEDIERAVISACKNSLYSYDEQLRRGFITLDSGVRLGLAGEFVLNGSEVLAIKNYSSLSIRIPHEVDGVSSAFFNKIYKGGSVLVVSRSGAGKTTFIRDLCKNLSKTLKNVVIIDERNEIAAKKSFGFNVGNTTDVLTFCEKAYGFTHAIRTLNPEVIITDELSSSLDVSAVIAAIYGGVDVVATIHAKSLNDAFNRDFASQIKKLKSFDYYVLISEFNGKRNFSYYDGNFNEICLQ